MFADQHSTSKPVFAMLLAWSLLQLWHASPLPFIFDFLLLNEAEARSMHLAIPLGLVFLTSRFTGGDSRAISLSGVAFAVVAVFCAAYQFFFYDELATRPGLATPFDLAIALIGMLLLIEGARRSLGPMLAVVAILFLFYAFAGQLMPDLIAHKGASLTKAVNHYWLSTEGVFGIALGVSTSLVFMFVLFGALLESAGAGNYFIRSAYAMMGKYKGGPGKAAVLASALTGMVSGSSTANVVTTGTFTIPLMKRSGFSAEKAGAIEVASSTNGQLMPPVMGAAAFLMAEYTGLSYLEVIKHAFLPALISYLALGYIVHLEASKLGLRGMVKRTSRSTIRKLMLALLGFLAMSVLSAFTYYGIGWIKIAFGDASRFVFPPLIFVSYLGLLWLSSRRPELPVSQQIDELPPVINTLLAGCYFLLPIILLLWCLILERLSPALSAFWATCFLLVIVLTQHPLKRLFRRQSGYATAGKQGVTEAINGLVAGARNMIPIAIATATAGIVVGTVTLTGVGFVLTELIEALSGGSLFLVLILTALISLILGMGLPTTANYIVVSTLMAPVIVNLGAANGLVVPLIAAHLFVFYFGILADDTPPVGLAAYAAAGISGGDGVKTGLQGFSYDIRTAILPFVFLFNTELLLIGVESWWQIVVIGTASTIAMLAFCAAVQRFMITRNRLWETLALLLVSFLIFRPGFIWDRLYPAEIEVAPTQLVSLAESAGKGALLQIQVQGEDFATGAFYDKVGVLPLAGGETGEQRLANSGLELRMDDGKIFIDNVGFDSQAAKAGFDFDQEVVAIKLPQERPSKQWIYLPALLLLLIVRLCQRRRAKGHKSKKPMANLASN